MSPGIGARQTGTASALIKTDQGPDLKAGTGERPKYHPNTLTYPMHPRLWKVLLPGDGRAAVGWTADPHQPSSTAFNNAGAVQADRAPYQYQVCRTRLFTTHASVASMHYIVDELGPVLDLP